MTRAGSDAGAGQSGATCNEEQIDACRHAASIGRLDTLRSGGECLSKRYMEFSHMCTVVDYLPTVDYCCCSHQQLVLCCRYHQDWNHFRCNEADDVVHIGSELNATYHGQSGLHRLPALSVLLPAVIVPLVVIICWAVGCVRCYKHYSKPHQYNTRRDDMDGCYSNKRRTTHTTTDTTIGRHVDCVGSDDGTTTPLTSSSLPVDIISGRSPCGVEDGSPWSSARGRCGSTVVEPTAPPAPTSGPGDTYDRDFYSNSASHALYSNHPYVQYGIVPYPSAGGVAGGVAGNNYACSCAYNHHRPLTVCTSGCVSGGAVGGSRHVIHHTYFRSPRPQSNGFCCGDPPLGVTASRCQSCGQHVAPPPYEEHWLRT